MLDCSLLTYKDSTYLLPTLAIAEGIILPAGFSLNLQSSCVGVYIWNQINRPILTLDLQPLGEAPIKNPKIALLHNTQQTRSYPYFAVLFEGQTRRVKLLHDNIVWTDEGRNIAAVTEKRSQIKVIVVDLAELSKEVELICGDIQVAK